MSLIPLDEPIAFYPLLVGTGHFGALDLTRTSG